MVDNEEKQKGKRKKKGEGVSSLAQTTFDLPASSLELPILSLQRRRTSLSLVLHCRSASAPLCLLLPSLLQMCCSSCLIDGGTEGLWTLQLDGGTEEARCCRSAPIGGTWPQPAQAAARLGSGRAATSPVGAGERVGTGELRLLVPLSLSCSRVWNLQRGRSLPLSRSLVWNLRRVFCYGVMRARLGT